jgi:hypothetical protein
MFALGQEAPTEEEVVSNKITAIQNVAQFRDELFEGNQGSAIKVIGGTLIGLYIVWRFLMK